MTLKNKDGSTALHYGAADGDVYRDGDVVQLGYFGNPDTFAPTATASNPFQGTFLALTQQTTIGDKGVDSDPDLAHGTFEFFDSNFVRGSDDVTHNDWGDLPLFSETVTNLSAKITALDAFHDPSGTGDVAYLAIRFWDARVDDAAGATSGFGLIDTTGDFKSMYNTMTDVTDTDGVAGTNDTAWVWADTQTGYNSPDAISLHIPDGANAGKVRQDIEWELPIHLYDSDGAQSITSDTSFLPNSDNAYDAEQFSAVITHFPDGGVILAGEFDYSGVGSASTSRIVSNFDVTSGEIHGGTSARELIIHSADGNTVANSLAPDVAGFTLDGDLLALTKIGAGDQKISSRTSTGGTITVKEGQLILSNTATGAGNFGTIFATSGTRGATSYVDILGTANLAVESTSAAGEYEWMRYITSSDSSTNAKLTFGDGDFNVELGLDATDGIKAFTGQVVTPDTVTNTGTIKVTDLGGWQQVGALSGTGDIRMEGSGVLEITGGSSGFSGDVKLGKSGEDGGTLIVSHANALGTAGIGPANAGGASGDFDRGKFSIKDGTTFADDIDTTGATGKTLIGGTGTFNKTVTINDAAGNNVFRELDPGLASSVSQSNTGAADGSPWQSVQSAGNTVGSFTATDLDWQEGGIYNWEIQDFDDTGIAGSDWDLFSFTDTSRKINFVDSQQRTIRIFGVSKAGYAGVDPGEAGVPDDWFANSAIKEFKFLDGPDGVTSFQKDGVDVSDGDTFDEDYFNLDDDQFNWLTQDWNGLWRVKYKGADNALYLTYSVVPEPSTYVMVVGALFLPVWNFFRRRRSRRKEDE